MTTSKAPPQPLGTTGMLTIGELAEAAGLTPEQLRTWEARHGFPRPLRLASGHRRYAPDEVRLVRRVHAERERGVRLGQAIEAALRSDDPLQTGSIYASLRARHPHLTSYTVRKSTLVALSWALEDECCAHGQRAIMVGAFQEGRWFGASRRRWEELARTARAALALADFAEHDDQALPARVSVPADSPLLREWIVLCESDRVAGGLVAWELPGQEDVVDGERLFETLWTVDAHIVRSALVMTAEVCAGVGSGAGEALGTLLEDLPAPIPASDQAKQAVCNRMVAYTDGTALNGRTR